MPPSATHHTRLGAPHVLILLDDDEPAMSSCPTAMPRHPITPTSHKVFADESCPNIGVI